MRWARFPLLLAVLATPLLADEQQWDPFEFLFHVLFGEVSHDYPVLAANAAAHEIDGSGACGFFTRRGERWRNTFADGSNLSLRCEPAQGGILPGFHLWYTDASGARNEIAKCIFSAGFNQGWYFTDAKHPERLVRVIWQNIDGGKDDGGLRHLDSAHLTGPEEPYIDVVSWVFDPVSRQLVCFSDKYQYGSKQARLPKRATTTPLDPYIGRRMTELRRTFVKNLD